MILLDRFSDGHNSWEMWPTKPDSGRLIAPCWLSVGEKSTTPSRYKFPTTTGYKKILPSPVSLLNADAVASFYWSSLPGWDTIAENYRYCHFHPVLKLIHSAIAWTAGGSGGHCTYCLAAVKGWLKDWIRAKTWMQKEPYHCMAADGTHWPLHALVSYSAGPAIHYAWFATPIGPNFISVVLRTGPLWNMTSTAIYLGITMTVWFPDCSLDQCSRWKVIINEFSMIQHIDSGTAKVSQGRKLLSPVHQPGLWPEAESFDCSHKIMLQCDDTAKMEENKHCLQKGGAWSWQVSIAAPWDRGRQWLVAVTPLSQEDWNKLYLFKHCL